MSTLPVSNASSQSNAPGNPAMVSNASQTTIGTGPVALDLVIVIDTSASMDDEAASLDAQIDAAIHAAQQSCPSSLRVTYLGIQGTWQGTKFDKSASDYLIEHGASQNDLQARPVGSVPNMGAQEDLCRAVIDVSKYFDWRAGARRSIFVLGDEGLEGGGGVLTNAAVAKNDEAIATAQARDIKVYTYQGTPATDNPDKFPTLADMDSVTKEYRRLAEETDGRAYIYTEGLANFTLIVEEILCHSLTPPTPHGTQGGSGCANVCDQLPAIIGTINSLAAALNKAIDACCGSSGGGNPQGGGTPGCNCGGKTPGHP
jgi:hypothetical protein